VAAVTGGPGLPAYGATEAVVFGPFSVLPLDMTVIGD
jgi:hypothetical protein